MRPAVAPGTCGRLKSFTLVELLVVIFIIAILTSIILAAAQGVMTSAARSRARAEIEAMKTALEAYKTDNGTYPLTNYFSGTNTYGSVDPTSANYLNSAETVYQALSGQTNFQDAHVAGVKSYIGFKANQLGNVKAAAGTTPPNSTFVQDPFGYAYGYTTGDSASPQVDPPNNGTGFYDIWSTAGTLSSTANNTNTWINNWSSQ